MSLFDWLRKKQTGDASSDLVIKPEENEFAGLDLKQVLDAHMAWRKRLERILAGDASEAVEVAQVAPDNLCMLGKWLHGTGKQQFLRFPEYGSLLLTHRPLMTRTYSSTAALSPGKNTGISRGTAMMSTTEMATASIVLQSIMLP